MDGTSNGICLPTSTPALAAIKPTDGITNTLDEMKRYDYVYIPNSAMLTLLKDLPDSHLIHVYMFVAHRPKNMKIPPRILPRNDPLDLDV